MKKYLALLCAVVMLAMLGACAAPAAPAVTETPVATEAVTEAPVATAEPTKAPLETAEVQLFIAASLEGAFKEIIPLYNAKEPNVKITYNADSSGTLLTQIQEGFACDVYFSAATSQVKTLDELRQFTIGQSASWGDVRILQGAGFKLVLADAYTPLFSMLGGRRFDLFARGAIEIEAEWRANRENVPGMLIEKRFVLHYPMPRYFFVPRTPEGERMAERIEDGLQRLRVSGEFERRYQAWKKLVLGGLQLPGRTVFRLPNPELSPEAPSDKFWWDDLGAELATPR